MPLPCVPSRGSLILDHARRRAPTFNEGITLTGDTPWGGGRAGVPLPIALTRPSERSALAATNAAIQNSKNPKRPCLHHSTKPACYMMLTCSIENQALVMVDTYFLELSGNTRGPAKRIGSE